MSAIRRRERTDVMRDPTNTPGLSTWNRTHREPLLDRPAGIELRLLRGFLRVVTGREAVEHRVNHHPCLPGARRVAEHDWEEVVRAQRLQSELAGGSHGGGPADPTEQGDLSEPQPRTERCHDLSVPDHLGLARLDHEVVVPDVALMEDDVTSGHVHRFQAASELLDG